MVEESNGTRTHLEVAHDGIHRNGDLDEACAIQVGVRPHHDPLLAPRHAQKPVANLRRLGQKVAFVYVSVVNEERGEREGKGREGKEREGVGG